VNDLPVDEAGASFNSVVASFGKQTDAICETSESAFDDATEWS